VSCAARLSPLVAGSMGAAFCGPSEETLRLSDATKVELMQSAGKVTALWGVPSMDGAEAAPSTEEHPSKSSSSSAQPAAAVPTTTSSSHSSAPSSSSCGGALGGRAASKAAAASTAADQSRSKTKTGRVGGAQVMLHVYDLGTSCTVVGLNRALRSRGCGLYHCGVEVHGLEWSFSGLPQEACDRGETGIFSCKPRCCDTHNFSTSVDLGCTKMGKIGLYHLLQSMEEDWQGDGYHLLSKNCQHFCQEFCRLLNVAPVPEWVTALSASGAMLVHQAERRHQECTTLCCTSADAEGEGLPAVVIPMSAVFGDSSEGAAAKDSKGQPGTLQSSAPAAARQKSAAARATGSSPPTTSPKATKAYN